MFTVTTRRRAAAIALAVAAPLAVASPAFASSLSVTGPPTAQQGGTITVHVSGTADEPELAWTAFVQNEACPGTFVAAQNQPDVAKQNKTQFQPGPFDFDSTLSATAGREPPFRDLTGTVNVCSYLYHEFTPDQATVATAANVVQLTGSTTGQGPFRFFGHMSTSGAIQVAATCPSGCALNATYRSSVARGSKTVTQTIPARSTPTRVSLKLDTKTVKLVRKIRRKHRGGPVMVTVDVTANPPSGAPEHASRVVKVS
jgi:hypothetical protein